MRNADDPPLRGNARRLRARSFRSRLYVLCRSLQRPAFAAAVCVFISAIGATARAQQESKRSADPETMFLELNKVHLGAISTEDDKKKFLYTIQLEKARISRRNMQVIYDNAYRLYRSGDFEGTQELTSKILSMDPSFEDAATLQRAAIELKGSGRPGFSENRLLDKRFDEGMALYRQGRLVEAQERLNEVVKLSVFNLKARYWLKRVNHELAEEHFRRGELAYRQHRFSEALDQWYSALILYPQYPRLVGSISKVEAELRQADANEKLQAALQFYSQGRNDESLKALDDVLKVQPGDSRAQRLQAEIRAEIANQHVAEGRRLYAQRQFNGAILQWKKAIEYGYDPRAADMLIARTKEQIRRQAEAKRQAEEAARQATEEAQRRAEEEAKAKAEAERKAKEETERKVLTPQAPPVGPVGVTEENRRTANDHYIKGIGHFQSGNYDKAKEEWLLCSHLDPSNADCSAGLQRIDQQLNGP